VRGLSAGTVPVVLPFVAYKTQSVSESSSCCMGMRPPIGVGISSRGGIAQSFMVASLALHCVFAGVKMSYHCVPERGGGCGRCLWQEGKWVWVVRRCVVWAWRAPLTCASM
jgi:hypothetical protein